MIVKTRQAWYVVGDRRHAYPMPFWSSKTKAPDGNYLYVTQVGVVEIRGEDYMMIQYIYIYVYMIYLYIFIDIIYSDII